MKVLGLDFDNTLVEYDNLFHRIAMERKLIGKNIPANKKLIREYLRSKGKEEEFTLLQGEIYGNRILEAEPSPGMLNTLKRLNKCQINIC